MQYYSCWQFLLGYWKTLVDEDVLTALQSGALPYHSDELSVEAKIFRPNVNSRDLKGWSCVCIAVFHDARKVLKLLLENGGDPNIRSTYNKNAWDIAKDELDAAEHVIKSKAEIRQVLIDCDTTNSRNANRLFGTGKPNPNPGQNGQVIHMQRHTYIFKNIQMRIFKRLS